MSEYRDTILQDREIVLDGNVYTGCTFKGCRLIYRGTEATTLSVCRFDNCSFALEGPARLTVNYLSSLYAHGGGFRDIVGTWLNDITKGGKG